MTRDIRHTWYFEHPPEVVWQYLTDAELLSQWLMETDFRPVVGHSFMFHAQPKVKLGFDGEIYCKVLEIVPCKKLSYSWKGGPGKGKITLDSIVTWTLKAKDNGTEVTLEHTGFAGIRNFIGYMVMNQGWKLHIAARLNALLNKQQ